MSTNEIFNQMLSGDFFALYDFFFFKIMSLMSPRKIAI